MLGQQVELYRTPDGREFLVTLPGPSILMTPEQDRQYWEALFPPRLRSKTATPSSPDLTAQPAPAPVQVQPDHWRVQVGCVNKSNLDPIMQLVFSGFQPPRRRH